MLGANLEFCFESFFGDNEQSEALSSYDGFFSLQRQTSELPKGTPSVPPLPVAAKIDLTVAIGPERDDDGTETRYLDGTMRSSS